MEEKEESEREIMHRLQSSFGTSSSSVQKQQISAANRPEIRPLHTSQIRSPSLHFSKNLSPESNPKRPGIPPSHPPFSPSSSLSFSGPAAAAPSHSRSLSQPAFFALDSLPPLSPSPCRDSSSQSLSDPTDVSMDYLSASANGQILNSHSPFAKCSSVRVGGSSESPPPRKYHRRSQSETPSTFFSGNQSSFLNKGQQGGLNQRGGGNSRASKQTQFVRDGDTNALGMEEPDWEGSMDELFSAYMNLDALNSGGPTMDKPCSRNQDDFSSRVSGTKTNGSESSDNDAESSVNESGYMNPTSEKREGTKRSFEAEGKPTGGSARHFRSVSMDSFMGKLSNLADESPKLPFPGNGSDHPHSNSMDEDPNTFNMDFDNGEFNGAELKKIMANEKLAEIAIADPKRAKRILANRQSAARSKERKTRYISELEHKVQILQAEATTLSAQLTLLQRDSTGLANLNNELKFRLQAMGQQAQLRDALNEALNGEVQRLKLATQELSEAHSTNSMAQLQMNRQMFQLPHQQPSHLSVYQSQQREQQRQQQQQQQEHHQQQQLLQQEKNQVAASKHEPKQ